MSTPNSPVVNGTRAKKIAGRRVRCVVYLPQEEAKYIDELAERNDQSQSSIIAQFYYQGKNAPQIKK